MSRPPSRRLRATWSMTCAISGRAFFTAAATLESSWLMMRAISRADLVSSPWEASFWLSVVSCWSCAAVSRFGFSVVLDASCVIEPVSIVVLFLQLDCSLSGRVRVERFITLLGDRSLLITPGFVDVVSSPYAEFTEPCGWHRERPGARCGLVAIRDAARCDW